MVGVRVLYAGDGGVVFDGRPFVVGSVGEGFTGNRVSHYLPPLVLTGHDQGGTAVIHGGRAGCRGFAVGRSLGFSNEVQTLVAIHRSGGQAFPVVVVEGFGLEGQRAVFSLAEHRAAHDDSHAVATATTPDRAAFLRQEAGIGLVGSVIDRSLGSQDVNVRSVNNPATHGNGIFKDHELAIHSDAAVDHGVIFQTVGERGGRAVGHEHGIRAQRVGLDGVKHNAPILLAVVIKQRLQVKVIIHERPSFAQTGGGHCAGIGEVVGVGAIRPHIVAVIDELVEFSGGRVALQGRALRSVAAHQAIQLGIGAVPAVKVGVDALVKAKTLPVGGVGGRGGEHFARAKIDGVDDFPVFTLGEPPTELADMIFQNLENLVNTIFFLAFLQGNAVSDLVVMDHGILAGNVLFVAEHHGVTEAAKSGQFEGHGYEHPVTEAGGVDH